MSAAPPPAAPLRLRLDGLSEPAGLPALGWACVDDETGAPTPDAWLVHAATREALAALREHPELAQRAADGAVVVQSEVEDAELEDDLLRLGVEAVVAPAPAAVLARTLRQAVQRRRVARSARTAYATDLATGLPHEAQLLEHMTQLVALREREPAPMVLLVLRVEGCVQAAARLGGEAGNVLRRKVAVRLRSGLRAADVVAALGPDLYGVLLGHLEAKGDGERVAAKLLRALQQPIVVAGQPCAVAATVGLAIFPDHGKDAAALLRRARAQAAGTRVGEGGGEPESRVVTRIGAAANDPAS